MVSSSKGKDPTSKAYKITPQDHKSTYRPLYFLLAIISGAA